MELKKASPSAPAIKWAVIGLITSIIITYAFQFLNVDPNSKVKWISYIPFIAFLCLTQKEYRDQLGGYLTYGEGFLSGFLYAVYTAVFTGIFTYVYFAILSPDMIEKILSASEAQMQGKNLSQDQIDTAMSMTKKFITPPVMAVFALIGTIIMGVIVALISAAAFKKERPPFVSTVDYDDPKPLDPTV